MAAAAVGKILAELVFFLLLALISECLRRVAARGGSVGTAHAFRISTLVCCWYSVSITLTLYNKWLVTSWKGGGLEYPIFYTMTHMMMKGCFSFSYLAFVRRKALPKASAKIIAGAGFIGAMTALDVACSNLAFLYISVTFFVMLKSASMVFILIAGAVCCVERCSVAVVMAVVVISSGIFLASYGEADFNPHGFALVLASEVFAALRWVVTQLVLQHGKLDSMTAVFYMSPASTMSLAPLVMSMEMHKVDALDDVASFLQYLLMVLFPGLLSFFLLLVEVQLVKETSSLTLSVFGNLKSVVTILLAIVLFRERATGLQWVGLVIALCGMAAYSRAKKRQMHLDALAALAYETLPDDEDSDEEQDTSLGAGCTSTELAASASPASPSGAGTGAGAGGAPASPGAKVLGRRADDERDLESAGASPGDASPNEAAASPKGADASPNGPASSSSSFGAPGGEGGGGGLAAVASGAAGTASVGRDSSGDELCNEAAASASDAALSRSASSGGARGGGDSPPHSGGPLGAEEEAALSLAPEASPSAVAIADLPDLLGAAAAPPSPSAASSVAASSPATVGGGASSPLGGGGGGGGDLLGEGGAL